MCQKFWILLRHLVSFHRDKILNLPSSLIKYIDNVITLSFHNSLLLYTNLISIAKVITRFILLCQLSTKLWFLKHFCFSPPFQTSFTNVFFIMNNTFKLSLISLLEFVFPHCYLNASQNRAKTSIWEFKVLRKSWKQSQIWIFQTN